MEPLVLKILTLDEDGNLIFWKKSLMEGGLEVNSSKKVKWKQSTIIYSNIPAKLQQMWNANKYSLGIEPNANLEHLTVAPATIAILKYYVYAWCLRLALSFFQHVIFSSQFSFGIESIQVNFSTLQLIPESGRYFPLALPPEDLSGTFGGSVALRRPSEGAECRRASPPASFFCTRRTKWSKETKKVDKPSTLHVLT